MNGLLHSKKFKKNLFKWLCMYIGVMGLLTTVVTYSKYMTTFEGGNTIEVAKFNVDIKDIKCSSAIEEYQNYCNYDAYRPTDEIEYYFIVDTTGLEVRTQFYLTFYINEDFTLESLKEIDFNSKTERNVVIDSSDGSMQNFGSGKNFKVLTVKNDKLNNIELGQGSVKVYKAILKYSKMIDGKIDYTNYNSLDELLIKVDFSAMQVSEKRK